MRRFNVPPLLVNLALLALTPGVVPFAETQTFTVLHTFTGGSDGAYPQAGLTIDQAGNLYGTTVYGGNEHGHCVTEGCGTVFRMAYQTSGWTFKTLYSFAGGDDGAYPLSGVTLGPDGSLYGTTMGQDFYNYGTVFRLRPSPWVSPPAPSWVEIVIHRFTGAPDGAFPQFGDLVFDQAGNIYGTTVIGGSSDGGTVFRLAPVHGRWTESILHSFTGENDGGRPYSGVIFDHSNNLYGTTVSGGTYFYGTVYQLANSGFTWSVNTLYSFNGGGVGGEPLGGLVADSAGNLYGTTYSGGPYGGGTAFELMPPGEQWTFSELHAFPGQAGSEANLTVDAAGNLYGTTVDDGTYGRGSVFELQPANGSWTYIDLHDFTGGSDGRFPYGNVVFDANGNLYGTTSSGGVTGLGVVFEIMR